VAGSRDTRVRRSERDWTAIIRRYEASGLGSRAFCRQEGLAASSVQCWRQRLRGQWTARRRARFVEWVPPQTIPSAVAKSSSSGWLLELEFPGGPTLRISGMTVATFTDSAKDAVGLKVAFGGLADGTVNPARIQQPVPKRWQIRLPRRSGRNQVEGLRDPVMALALGARSGVRSVHGRLSRQARRQDAGLALLLRPRVLSRLPAISRAGNSFVS
jgi:hypothetical protein